MDKIIKSKDMFGHTINLNFNKQGDTHQTVIGGFLSILIKVAITVYVILNVKKLVRYEDDRLGLEVEKINLDQLRELSLRNSSMFLYWTLRKQVGNIPVYIGEEKYRRYIDVHFQQRRDDWYKTVEEGRYTTIKSDAK